MGKEKREKSTTSDVDFPAGEWSVYIQNGIGSVDIGSLDLAEESQSPEQYNGTMDFGDNPDFGPIRNGGYSVDVVTFDPETGVIYFKIPEAALEYNQNTSPPYQFVFIGWYCKPGELCGSARVPKGFGQGQGKPGEDGDDVTWIAKGITDPPHKPSR